MNSISGTSSYDLLANYSTAASSAITTENESVQSTSEFIQAVQEVLSEAEELLTQDGDETSAVEDADLSTVEDDENDDSDDSSSSDDVTDLGSTFYRPDGSDPLEPDDGPSDELSFSDMLMLMVAQFQSQTIDNTASTTDMMNQLLQMTSVQAMTSMEEGVASMTSTTEMLYTSSLVGKEITVGYFDKDGAWTEETGEVTGAGYYGGFPVVFIDGKDTFFYTSEILAVGRLPESSEDDDGEGDLDVDPDIDVDADNDVSTENGSTGESDSVDTDSSDADGDSASDGSDDTGSTASLLGYNYVDYSNLSSEELLEASLTALG